MSKKRDALRRGIRELIQDTSKDLVAFEGHEVRRRDAPTVPHPEAPALNGGPLEAVADRPAGPAEQPAAAVEPDRRRDAGPAGEAHVPQPVPARDASPEPVAFELIADTAFVPLAAPRSTPPKTRGSASSRPAPKRAKPQRSSATRKGRRAPGARPGGRSAPAAPDDAGEDSVNPMPVQSRTGVCRSYFINHECWRVPNAYCNTALQVCVIRNCPVYHLHKDALERRFAKKFKHFW